MDLEVSHACIVVVALHVAEHQLDGAQKPLTGDNQTPCFFNKCHTLW